MPQDLLTIQKSLVERRQKLIGSKINRIIEPDSDEVVLTLFNGKVFNLIISTSAKYCRVGLTYLDKPSPLTAPNFCMLMRKYLSGGEITGIDTLPNDRIIKITITNQNDFKEFNEYFLYAEIMGKYSNIFLTANGVILGSLKTTPQTLEGKRLAMTGSIYTPPQSQNKCDVTNKEQVLEVLKTYNGENLDKFILANFSYFSPITASELAYQINKTLPFNADTAYSVINGFITKKANPVLISYGNSKEVFANDYTHIDGERKYSQSLLELQAEYYDKIQSEQVFLNGKNAILSKILAKVKKEEKKLYLCEEKEREFNNSHKYKLYGELITANLYAIKKGDSKLKALNYYEEQETYVEIPLDTTLTPAENSQKYYKKYAKQKRAYTISLEQKQEILNELNYLSSLKNSVELASNVNDFKEIEEELVLAGLMRDNSPNKRKKQVKKHNGYTLYKIEDFSVKLGKNNLQNDELLSSAERLDVWLHVKNYHSSFVIIETKGKEVPDSVLLKSAEICASHSEVKNGSKIEVDYTFKKFVKKPPQAKPGSVIYTDYKTIIVNPNSHDNLII